MKDALVGKCFHIVSDLKQVVFQGIVRDKIDDEHYLIQYFDFIMGDPSTMKIVEIGLMKGWQFYDTDEEMDHWYKYHSVKS